jgi:NMD protein affecting ribosome stability and mRNA decay
MNKVSFREMSDRKCIKCGKALKMNLILKKPNASMCYKCYKRANP